MVIMDMIMRFTSHWGLLFLAENESKDPMIYQFALIVAVLLYFALSLNTFEQTRDLNDFV